MPNSKSQIPSSTPQIPSSTPQTPSSKLLIIYYNFPPVKVPGALRIYNLCRTAPSHFSHIYGLTTSNRRFSQQDPALVLPEVPLLEVPAWDLRRLSKIWRSGDRQPFVSTSVKQSFWGKWLRKLVDSFPFNVLIGDGGLIYILKGYRAGKRLVREQGITHIFSTFRPYSDHVIGHLLKRKFPALVWVADFRDLHVDPITKSTFFPGFQLWCNHQVLRKADLVTTVSSGLERHLSAIHLNTFVLYNGILQLPKRQERGGKSDKFIICYTGSLFFDQRDPKLLLEILVKLLSSQTRKFELIYAGKDGAQWQEMIREYELEAISTNLGLVSLEEARQLQRGATVNLLLTYNSPELQGNLTGKIYEYFAAGRPIIALVKGIKDPELETILSEVDGGIVVYQDESGTNRLEKFILDQYRIWEQTGHLPDRITADGLERFYWPQMLNRLMERLHA